MKWRLIGLYAEGDRKPYSLEVIARKGIETSMNNYIQFETLEEFEKFKNKTISELKQAGQDWVYEQSKEGE